MTPGTRVWALRVMDNRFAWLPGIVVDAERERRTLAVSEALSVAVDLGDGTGPWFFHPCGVRTEEEHAAHLLAQ
jgi:hypothetical protein